MRIRTIKPEFWQHETMACLPDFTRLMAIALLNWADDEGYFMASVHLIRGALFPFDDDSSKIHRALLELSEAGWIELGTDAQSRQIGRVVKFSTHQRIDRPKKSIIKALATFDEASTTAPESIEEPSLLEWNREREEEREEERNGKAPSVPQGGSVSVSSTPPLAAAESEPDPVDSKAESGKPKKKRGGAAAAPVFPADLSAGHVEALTRWWHYKAERRETYSASGWEALVEREGEFSAAQVTASVRASMSNNWAGLFTHKVENLPEKKEGGPDTAEVMSRGTGAPALWEHAMEALWGAEWRELYAAWELLPPADQRQVRSWLATHGPSLSLAIQKNKGGAAEA